MARAPASCHGGSGGLRRPALPERLDVEDLRPEHLAVGGADTHTVAVQGVMDVGVVRTRVVVVQDGQTVGLAGLITDNASTGNGGIPWLKDVPILGLLAGNQTNARQRTELLVLITPHVIHDQRDARALTNDLREQLINAAAVPDRLNNLPPSGQSDPSERLRKQLRLQQ